MISNNYKYLLKNIGILTISNIGSKIFSFILIPLFTTFLTTLDYGKYDLCYTTISLFIPILSLNIVEAVMRYSIEKKYNASEVFSIGLKYVLRATLILIALVALNYYFNIILIIKEEAIYVVILFFLTALYDLFVQYCRGMEKIKELAIAGFLNTFSMVIFNIVFLMILRLGLDGYFIANCLSYLIPIIYIMYKLKIYGNIQIKASKKLEKEMLEYSRPTISNTISWWINNVSDRYVVTYLIGAEANGIYSIAYKIPSVLNVFQTIFGQAWTISAIKELNEKNYKFYVNIYEVYNCLLVIVCSCLIILDKIIAKILFSHQFFEAWKYAPFLMISVVFGGLSGYLGGIFAATKNSKLFAKTTTIGAVLNIFLNLILVKVIGIMGAAISTLIAYFVVWILRIIYIKKIINLKFNIKIDLFIYFILIIQAILLYLEINLIIKYLLQIILLLIITVLYRKNIYKAISKNFKRKEVKDEKK